MNEMDGMGRWLPPDEEEVEEQCPNCSSEDTGTISQRDTNDDLIVSCSRCFSCGHDWNFA